MYDHIIFTTPFHFALVTILSLLSQIFSSNSFQRCVYQKFRFNNNNLIISIDFIFKNLDVVFTFWSCGCPATLFLLCNVVNQSMQLSDWVIGDCKDKKQYQSAYSWIFIIGIFKQLCIWVIANTKTNINRNIHHFYKCFERIHYQWPVFQL